MRSVLVPICMLLVLTQTFSKWLVILDYRLNKDFIAKNICVNRARPAMHCNGKCFLKKQLNKTEKDDPANPAPVKSIEDTVYIAVPSASDTAVCLAVIYHVPPPFKKDHYRFCFLSSCFHPPCIA